MRPRIGRMTAMQNLHDKRMSEAADSARKPVSHIYCGMCNDTGLQNGQKCPQPGCRKANGLPPFDNEVKHRHLIEKERLESVLSDPERTNDSMTDARVRLTVLNGIIKLATELRQDSSLGLCYEDVCTLIVELI